MKNKIIIFIILLLIILGVIFIKNEKESVELPITLSSKYYNTLENDKIKKIKEEQYNLNKKLNSGEYEGLSETELEKMQDEIYTKYAEVINQEIQNKSSFVIAVMNTYDESCGVVELTVINYLNYLFVENNMFNYEINLTTFKQTSLYDEVKYAPTVIIVHKGKILTYLDQNNNDHIKIYNDEEEFRKWITKNVKLGKE